MKICYVFQNASIQLGLLIAVRITKVSLFVLLITVDCRHYFCGTEVKLKWFLMVSKTHLIQTKDSNVNFLISKEIYFYCSYSKIKETWYWHYSWRRRIHWNFKQWWPIMGRRMWWLFWDWRRSCFLQNGWFSLRLEILKLFCVYSTNKHQISSDCLPLYYRSISEPGFQAFANAMDKNLYICLRSNKIPH